MYIIDLHCDVLYKIWESKGVLRFNDSTELDANKVRLKRGQVKVQCFAIFIPPELKSEEKFQAALDQIDYFYSQVLENNSDIVHIKNWEDLAYLQPHEIGAILTLEGVDCIGNDLHKLSILFHLGVRSVGLTWNFANLAADGVWERRGAGLTSFGIEIVKFNNKNKVFTDVSHLSEKGFWDVMDLADFPFASHSNSKAICDHPRNLSDEQAKALLKKSGLIHVVYHPPFVTQNNTAYISDLIRHIDHFCSLGGVKQIGIGSDFDGIETHIVDLENASKHQNLINELLKYYAPDQVKGFAGENFLRHLPN
ncbi:dipeptidase [Lederbergia panacisoli]|uniref:dipeptidase n=1 Tax=Lederbergia panacisoli TaxID=1255251 RepID=UPI00214B8B2B|nr:dipeptidase [Lederbergia panacisoli]MCR2821100.1 dipeptidase [Lederbergia panacisoli]